nr:MAG TPA: hypothetical protein [Caudoviricetes sp.]
MFKELNLQVPILLHILSFYSSYLEMYNFISSSLIDFMNQKK